MAVCGHITEIASASDQVAAMDKPDAAAGIHRRIVTHAEQQADCGSGEPGFSVIFQNIQPVSPEIQVEAGNLSLKNIAGFLQVRRVQLRPFHIGLDLRNPLEPIKWRVSFTGALPEPVQGGRDKSSVPGDRPADS